MLAHLKTGRAELEHKIGKQSFKYSNVSLMPPPKQYCGTMLAHFAKFEEEISFDTKVSQIVT